ncbi:hypothetical protein GALMADRAFT_135472 [Galerina marginata CBS 339.88]|uniref:G domain-containing protein n=1 Tax=Galerina marginata (strain CBS 339.88) TaxID=685588 RepID=A0A067TG35_GALM3|nr:hypothetical protein GALMADRAFT_135472 [Galerina marginata CBS 339.88]
MPPKLISRDSGTVILCVFSFMQTLVKLEIQISLLGESGSGKSTFINAAAQKAVASVNPRLTSREVVVKDFILRHPLSKHSFVFVDTPGFNNATVSDTGVLEEIIDWLEYSCDLEVPFGGILYIQDIKNSTIHKMAQQTLERLTSSHKLDDCVTIVTTKISSLREEFRSKRVFILEEAWKTVISNGAKICQFEDTVDSAWSMVDTLPINRQTLLLRDLLDELKQLIATPPPSSRRPLSCKNIWGQLVGLFTFHLMKHKHVLRRFTVQ